MSLLPPYNLVISLCRVTSCMSLCMYAHIYLHYWKSNVYLSRITRYDRIIFKKQLIDVFLFAGFRRVRLTSNFVKAVPSKIYGIRDNICLILEKI